MNIYFTISLRNALNNKERSQEAINLLQSLGHKVTLRTVKVEDALKAESATGIVESSTEDVKEVYKKTVRKIREADVIIADTSPASSSVGYEIAMAQTERKPILVLHDTANINVLGLVSGNTSKLFKVIKFSDSKIPRDQLESFLKDAREMVDTKFILIISPEIDRYLTWSSETNRLHKAQIVRNAVEEVMAKDKEYKQYLNEISA